MSCIEKRVHASGKTTYRVRIRLSESPSISESFPAKREAREWDMQMEANVRQGRYFGKSESKELTFQELVDRYIEIELPKNSDSFTKLRLQLFWWNHHLKNYYLCRITPALISELKEQLVKEVTFRKVLRTPSTANRYLAALSGLFRGAVKEWNWMNENPLPKVSKFKEGKARDRYLTKEEIEKLLEKAKKSKSLHLYPITLFAVCTGARRGEILGLQWKDLDLERKTATFRETKNGDTKTISLSPPLVNCLLEEKKKRVICSPYLFPSQDARKFADIRKAWDLAIEEAGLDICFHILRHTAASYLAMGGASALEVGVILGHKTLAMVKRYSRLSFSATAKVLNRMNEEVLGNRGYGT